MNDIGLTLPEGHDALLYFECSTGSCVLAWVWPGFTVEVDGDYDYQIPILDFGWLCRATANKLVAPVTPLEMPDAPKGKMRLSEWAEAVKQNEEICKAIYAYNGKHFFMREARVESVARAVSKLLSPHWRKWRDFLDNSQPEYATAAKRYYAHYLRLSHDWISYKLINDRPALETLGKKNIALFILASNFLFSQCKSLSLSERLQMIHADTGAFDIPWRYQYKGNQHEKEREILESWQRAVNQA